jgi:ketosteroid isomerase-like protein
METDAPAARSPFTFDEALAEHLGALRARDVARFAATLGSDVLVVDGRAGITRGTENVLRSHAEWFASPDDWTFEYTVLMTRAFAGAALALVDVTYRNTPRSEPSRFVLSLVFERDASGAWTFVYDQNTPHPAD